MKLLITLLLFATLSAKGQTPFALANSYPISWIVEYPINAQVYWQASKAVKATKYPSDDPANWKRYYYTWQLPARQSFVDSLLARIIALEKNPTVTFRVSQSGIPLIMRVNDSLYTARALQLGPGLIGTQTDSTTYIDIKK